MPSTIGPASITLHGHIDADGAVVENCKITFAGSEASIWCWNAGDKRFRPYDKILDFELTDKKKYMELTGVSETLRREARLSPEQAKVRLEVRVKECVECR